MGLDAKIKSLQSITDRADKMTAIYVAIVIVLCIYIIPNYKLIAIDYFVTAGVLMLCFCFIALYFCFKNIGSYTLCDLGSYPSNIFRSEYIDNDYEEKEKYIVIGLAVIRNIQARMEYNDAKIANRVKNNAMAINQFFFISLSPVLAFIIILLK